MEDPKQEETPAMDESPQERLPPPEETPTGGENSQEMIEPPEELPAAVESPQDRPEPTDDKPALTINFQTWATPIVGLIMLLVGLAAGYFSFPIINDGDGSNQLAALNTPAPEESEVTPVTGEEIDVAQPTPEDLEARRQALMDALIAQTKHFRGDPNAPVTLIEFSDFQ